MKNFNYKKVSPWEKVNIQKKLANQLKAILKKCINDEKLSDNEKEFLKVIVGRDNIDC